MNWRRARGLAAACLCVLVLRFLGGNATSGFAGSVSNKTDTHAAGTGFLKSVADAVTQCDTKPAATPIPTTSVFACTGNTFPVALTATGNVTAAHTLSNSGTYTPASATYSAAACGPVQITDAITATDPMLVRGTVTFAQSPGPLTGSAGLGTDGATGFAADIVNATGLQTFSLGVWFKTTASTGTLIGYSNSPNMNSLSHWDRHLYLTATGKLVIGMRPNGSVQTVTSAASVNDGVWHLAIATLATPTPSGQPTLTLYLDGTSVGSLLEPSSSGVGAETGSGYWHVGAGNSDSGWSGNGKYFNGVLADAFVTPVALSAAQITTLRNSATQTAWLANVAALKATHSWPLGDTGLTTYAGTVPNLSVSPCTMVNVSVGAAAFCVYPNNLGASCPAQSSTNTLQTLTSAPALSFVASGPTTPQTLTTTLARGPTFDTTWAVGLHLLQAVTIIERVGGFTNTLTWASNSVTL